MKRFFAITVLFLTACSGSATCPSQKADQSNLPVNPGPSGAIIVHPNGIDTTWTWQLTGDLNTGYSVDVYDIDLFETTEEQINTLHNAGKKVICYMSGGSSENFRPDFLDFNESDMGKELDGWPGERWLDIRSANVLKIMNKRMDLAVEKGCDGVEPDNMDGFLQDTCFDLTKNDQLAYNRKLANMAHDKGLSIALKNTPDLVAQLVDYYDFSMVEECYTYNECTKYVPFINQNKPVFEVEYEERFRTSEGQNELCDFTQNLNIQSLVLDLYLDDTYRYSCF